MAGIWYVNNAGLLGATYLLGSIPTGYCLGKWLKGIDIREHGSGSTGATNVLRVLGKGPGLVVLLLDILKGALAIALVQYCYALWASQLAPVASDWLPSMTVLAGFAAILGHSKPIWLQFEGGKSVATSLGILVMMNWQVALATLVVFILVLALSRIVSLSSLVAALSLPLWMYLFEQPWPYLGFSILGGLYVVIRHRSNIQRLFTGHEPKLGSTPPLQDAP
ncbi:glycerol-3-phosphate 1-O-acyltransferase PlsY [Synechococcales cyanobacterium C]|uniref:Glycerol-3-phosphate acyltransferase n=1 Tax=Petrachloros mirabilis ULC683 TaxID=2781853 RepID=A0A8K2A7C0_9CYAN|nr:glycerol-3-phosphate 1-O-acyltransferase PlsY [Petrachloros mirabilis]NCJ06039.1 glycerol-3-phosphate 1-O-acyltransferase PlsY [Petrachloros mirabilis ULC683]